MIEITPIENLNAEVKVPGSKSYTNRALLIAAMAKGTSRLTEVLLSEDTKYMMQALKDFGIDIKQDNTKITVEGRLPRQPKEHIFLGNAGTATRFLTTYASLLDKEVTITGDKRMQERPIQDLLDALTSLGVTTRSNNGCPPITIKGPLKGGKTKLKGSISSQYLSSLLMSCPLAEKPVEIEIIGDLTSKSYIDITLDVMKEFGILIKHNNYKHFNIEPQKYRAADYQVEGDASNSSYFLAAAAITKGTVKVTNLNPDSAQGDIHFAEVLEKMGCKIKKGPGYIQVTGSELKGIDIDMNQMPDTVQTLAVVAAFAKGKTTIKNVENLKVKETDRINAVKTELEKLGTEVQELPDGLIINPKPMHGAEIETYDDHRMAMSFAVAGLRIPNIIIKDPNCVDKSFPDYFKVFEGLYG